MIIILNDTPVTDDSLHAILSDPDGDLYRVYVDRGIRYGEDDDPEDVQISRYYTRDELDPDREARYYSDRDMAYNAYIAVTLPPDREENGKHIHAYKLIEKYHRAPDFDISDYPSPTAALEDGPWDIEDDSRSF